MGGSWADSGFRVIGVLNTFIVFSVAAFYYAHDQRVSKSLGDCFAEPASDLPTIESMPSSTNVSLNWKILYYATLGC
jgi:hypothetical protein